MRSTNASVLGAERAVKGLSLSERLTSSAEEHPERIYARDRAETVTYAELNRRVSAVSTLLSDCGVTSQSRVVLSLPVSVDHIVLIFALLRIGALWIPLNTSIKGDPLLHQLADSKSTHIIGQVAGGAVEATGDLLDPIPLSTKGLKTADLVLQIRETFERSRADSGENDRSRREEHWERVCLLMYTSGTTGPPKGALVTESMLKAAVLGAIEATDPEPGDVFYVWEPLFHIGGAQMVFVPLFENVSLALAERFSASRFWQDIVDFDVTHIHYLGGVLQILLQREPDEPETTNRVRIAWGAGATPEVWQACAQRFGFDLHECYGMTEASSIVTVNRNDPHGGVGKPLPWVDIVIRPRAGGDPTQLGSNRAAEEAPDSGESGDESHPLVGEIAVRGLIEGLVTPGYLGRPDATAKSRDGEWLLTGDLGRLDEMGNLHFSGRGSDSIRVRGENISAWQIESVFGLHPGVDRCAAVGVDAEVGEQEVLLLVTSAEGQNADPRDLLDWGRRRLARFQLPRYVRVIDEMPLTPSQRVSKHKLDRSLVDAFDSRHSDSSG